MKKWILKAIVQKTISYLPKSHSLNYFFQKHVTKGVHLSDYYFYTRLDHVKEHLNAYAEYSGGGERLPDSTLELGTGWYPIIPLCFFLAGVNKIYSVDISFLTSKERIKTSLEKLIEARQNGKLDTYFKIDKDRWDKLENTLKDIDKLSLAEILIRFLMHYFVEDARKLSLKDNSIDLVNSNNTFEHIYPEILKPILLEFKRVVNKKHGVMSHAIDMTDHFAHFDKSITIYNFLKYSEKQWRMIDNTIQPQNRLRFGDYLTMYEELNIPITHTEHSPGNIDEAKSVSLHKDFLEKNLKDIAISHCHIVSKMGDKGKM